MKKTFPKKNVPLSPLLLPPFHISRGKKKLTSTPLPLNSKKKKKKKSTCTISPNAPFPPSHNEFVKKNYPLPLPSLSTMKKTFPEKKCTPFPPPPSTFSYI